MFRIFALTVSLLLAAAHAQEFALPEAGAELRVVVLGDFNGPYGTVGYAPALARLVERIPSWQPDLVLLPGDLIAGQDHSLPAERFAGMWDGFDREVAQPLRQAGIPFAASLGNHDGSSLRTAAGFTFARERAAASDYWQRVRSDLLVREHDTAGFPFDWSFSVGGLFVIVWDASSAMVTSGQLEWLHEQLASEAALAADFRWLVGHLPLVGVAERRDRPGEVLSGGSELASELRAAGLDTYVSGHQAAWYPGELGGLELLMSGGLGGRRLIAGSAPVRSTVTVVDLWPSSGAVTYTTFDIMTGETVHPEELPAELAGFGGHVRLSGRARGGTHVER